MTRSRILHKAAVACMRLSSAAACAAADLAQIEFKHAVSRNDGLRRLASNDRANAQGLADGYAQRALDYIKRV